MITIIRKLDWFVAFYVRDAMLESMQINYFCSFIRKFSSFFFCFTKNAHARKFLFITGIFPSSEFSFTADLVRPKNRYAAAVTTQCQHTAISEPSTLKTKTKKKLKLKWKTRVRCHTKSFHPATVWTVGQVEGGGEQNRAQCSTCMVGWFVITLWTSRPYLWQQKRGAALRRIERLNSVVVVAGNGFT